MSTDWILKTKLVAPVPPASGLERSILAPGPARPSVALLVAGPGYGKTLALAALARRATAEGALVAWYSLDAYDGDPATFFHYLVAAMRQHVPQFGVAVEALLVGEAAPAALWQRFFRDLMAFNIPQLVLVLDDCHVLLDGAPELLAALVPFLDRLPPGLSLLMASRRRLPFRLARLRTAGKLVELGPEQLRFTADEQAAFLRARSPAGEVPAAWLRRAAALDGWPLGLDLISRPRATIADAAVATGAPADAEADLRDFVREELYDGQPLAMQRFLLQLAILHTPTATACEAIFGAADADERLRTLEAALLVFGLADGAGYRLPAFLRDFLETEGRRTLAAAVLADWHARAAAYHLAGDRAEEALPHLVASADWVGLASACQRCFPAMVGQARQAQIDRWLAAVPAGVAAVEPTLLLWRGIAFAHRGRHAEARDCYDQARKRYAEADDDAGELKAVVRLCGVSLLGHDDRHTNQFLLQAQALLGGGRPEDLADLHLLRAMAAERRGDMALMRECNEAVLAIAVASNVEVATCHCVALFNLFTWWHHAGDLVEARRSIDHVVGLADGWHFHAYRLFGSFLQAALCLTGDDVEGAGALLRGMPADWPERLDWHDRACALAIVGHHLTATGAWKEADEALRKARATFREAGSPEGEKVVLERQLWLAVLRQQPARALELFAEAGAPAADNIFDLVLATPHARALHLAGDALGARAVWRRAVPALADLGAHLHLARARLYQAATDRALGDHDLAREGWRLATEAMDARGYGFLRTQDRRLWEDLRPLVEAPVGSEPAAAAGTTALPLGSERVADPGTAADPGDVVGSPGKLVVNLFGTFEVFQAGVRLDHWPRRKARLVLAALALYPRGLPIAALAELVGESIETPAYLSSIRTNIMLLRKTLEPDLDRRQTSRYILFETDRYVLDLAAVEAIDVRTFEVAMAAGERGGPEAAAHFRQAVDVYRGSLLEDGWLGGSFDSERQRYRRQVLAALDGLANDAHQRVDRTQEEVALARAAAIAPCEEEIALKLFRFLVQARRPEHVRQAYWDHRKALKATLGIEPSAAFEAAYRDFVGSGKDLARKPR